MLTLGRTGSTGNDYDNNDNNDNTDTTDSSGLCAAVADPAEHRRIMALVQDLIVRAYINLKATIQSWLTLQARGGAAIASQPTAAMLTGVQAVETVQHTAFIDTEPSHEAKLRDIWALLMPAQPYVRLSSQWGEVMVGLDGECIGGLLMWRG